MTTTDLIVPWVALWSDEQVDQLTVDLELTATGLRYRDEMLADRIQGILWHREGIAQGSGEPLYGEVHSRRQRRAMVDPRCQVCGRRLPKIHTPWLIPQEEWDLFVETDNFTTTTPPTCEECWPMATARCPHLRRDGFIRFHATPISWGVFGGLYHPLRRAPRVSTRFGSTDMPFMIAKQVTVKLTDRVATS